MKDYGLQVFARGVVIHTDRVPRKRGRDGGTEPVKQGVTTRGDRGVIRAFSEQSRRRFEFLLANVQASFACLLTLTYHARCESWEGDTERNRRMVLRSKRDLNRLLTCLRRKMGRYAWVQEFQRRGVVHYHVLCEQPVTQERASIIWCSATGEADDAAAMLYAVKVEPVESAMGARSYLGRYLGKGRQKSLPKGVDGAGRWWGLSRGIPLVVVREVKTRAKDEPVARRCEARIARSVRRWLSKRVGFKVRGGTFVDWGSKVTRPLVAVLDQLTEFYELADAIAGSER